jgi:D-glycero-alpha-D-manno-heptose-7-phosphate kinase
LDDQIASTKEQKIDRELGHLLELTAQAVRLLESADPEALIRDFGAMMHEGWMTKRKLSPKVSTPEIDDLYGRARAAGAYGGKLCGAGGGGFMLLVVPPEARSRFEAVMAPMITIPVGLDTHGSVILHG